MQKIFIAGSNGMVGSAIKKAYYNINIEDDSIRREIFCPTRKELDLTDFSLLDNWFAKNKPNIVINAAAKVGGILANKKYPYEFILENLKIQTNLIELSNKHKVSKFLFLGSSCIYPKYANQPILEESLLSGSLEETNQFYAIAKIAGIKLCESLSKQYGFNAICLMPTNLYGPGDNYHTLNSHVLPSFIRKFITAKNNDDKNVICWGTGTPLREFLFVDDLAEACLFAIENWDPNKQNAPKDKKGNSLYWLNVGSEEEISISNLANLVAEIVDYRGEIIWDNTKPDGTPRKKLNTSRMKKLGWEAKVNLYDGIKKTIESFKAEFKYKKLRI